MGCAALALRISPSAVIGSRTLENIISSPPRTSLNLS